MDENERVVCEFLRKIAPPREWEYLGEVEHYWISQLCDDLNKQLKAELRELAEENKKLRVDWESERDYANQMEAIAERLKAENAKLRKYAESYVGVVKAGGCDLCPYCEDFETCEDADAEPMSEGCALYMQMSELGIEA